MSRRRAQLARIALVSIVLAVTVGGSPAPAVAAVPRPNIVILVLDDIPAGAARILLERTTHIRDVFLDHGQEWTSFHAQDPLCCPGRAGILTGLYSSYHGVTENDARLFHPEETIGRALQRVGYWTVYSGKYLNKMGYLADKSPPGWSRFAGSGQGYFAKWWINDNLRLPGYHTTAVQRYAMNWLVAAPRQRKLLLMLMPFAIHSGGPGTSHPLPAWFRHGAHPAPQAVDDGHPACADIAPYRTPAYYEEDVSDKPAWVQALPATPPNTPETALIEGWPLVKECEALQSVDRMFGKVADELRRQGRFGNTLFILTADNGMAWGNHRWTTKSVAYATHIPLWIRWPAALGGVPHVVDVPSQATDLAPTLAELAGATLGPYPTGQLRPDGKSLAQTILSRGATRPSRGQLIEEHIAGGVRPAWRGIRTTNGRWHLVSWENGEVELYDLRADPWELDNLAAEPAYGRVERNLLRRLNR
jgi:arylsulfatase A-like enzyme